MSILAELVDHVIGVDPDRDRFSVAAVEALSKGEVAHGCFAATSGGYLAALDWADDHTVSGRRVWAIEGAGSWGSGLCRALRQAGEWVIEFSFPSGPAASDGAKTDHLDALRAGREVLGRARWADPRNADGHAGAISAILGLREMLVGQRTALLNHLKSLLVTGPTAIAENLGSLTNSELMAACARFRPGPDVLDDVADTKFALRAAAKQIIELNDTVADLHRRLSAQLELKAPQLLASAGIGPVTAAAAVIVWSHPRRVHSEAAFAKIGGTNPVPIDSGQHQNRHRLNRRGDRRLNRALHTVVLSRSSFDPETKAYIARRVSEGRTPREARRCLIALPSQNHLPAPRKPPTHHT